MTAAQSEKQRQKEVEFRCIQAVARATDGKAVREDEANQWPDGWLEYPDGKREPVEVVAAFRRPTGEEAKKGSAWIRNWKQGEAGAGVRRDETGEVASWYVGDGDDGFLLLDEATVLPPATTPISQDDWVLLAVGQKIAKGYVSDTPAVLIVQLH